MKNKYILTLTIVFFIFVSGCVSPNGQLDTNFSFVGTTDVQNYNIDQNITSQTNYVKTNESLGIINDSEIKNNTKVYEKNNFNKTINVSDYSTEQLFMIYNLSILDYTTPSQISNNSDFLDTETVKSANNSSDLKLISLIRTSNISISSIVDRNEVVSDIPEGSNYGTINSSKYSILPTPRFKLYNISFNPLRTISNRTALNVEYQDYENLSIGQRISNGTYRSSNVTYNYVIYSAYITKNDSKYIANYIQSTKVAEDNIVILTGLYSKNSNEKQNIIDMMKGTEIKG